MSYRAGIGPGLKSLGMEPGPPHFRCDAEGCNGRYVIGETRTGMPPAWFFKGKPPPLWRTVKPADGSTRRDYCPLHHPQKDHDNG